MTLWKIESDSFSAIPDKFRYVCLYGFTFFALSSLWGFWKFSCFSNLYPVTYAKWKRFARKKAKSDRCRGCTTLRLVLLMHCFPFLQSVFVNPGHCNLLCHLAKRGNGGCKLQAARGVVLILARSDFSLYLQRAFNLHTFKSQNRGLKFASEKNDYFSIK